MDDGTLRAVRSAVNPTLRAVALVLTLGLLAAFSWMVRLVVTPVLIAAVFAIVLAPLTSRLAKRLGSRATLAPALVTVGTLLGILGPAGLLGTLTVLQLRSVKGSGFASAVETQTGALIRLAQRAGSPLASFGIDMSTAGLRTWLEGEAQRLLAWLGGLASETIAATPDLIIGAFLFVLALYFWLRDGHAAVALLSRALPLADEEAERLFTGVRDAARGVLISEVFTGAVQSALALGFLAALRVPGAFLWGVLAFGLSFIPVFGTTPVTLGAVVYLLATGRHGAAVVMGVGVLIVGSADNVVRPLVASNSAHLHPLLVLLAIFGGLAALGPSGVFFGPILAALAVWAVGFHGRLKNA
jgi:predicted PurR-regulated permease PerM